MLGIFAKSFMTASRADRARDRWTPPAPSREALREERLRRDERLR